MLRTAFYLCAATSLPALAGCAGDVPNGTPPDTGIGDTLVDADTGGLDAADGSVGACDLSKPFGPLSLEAALDASNIVPRGLSRDELVVYFHGAALGDAGVGKNDLYVARRSATTDAFGPPTLLSATSSSADDLDPILTFDQLGLYFHTDRAGSLDIYVATRTTTATEFGAASAVANVNSPSGDIHAFSSADGSELWFASDRTAGRDYDLFRATRGTAGWNAPETMVALDSAQAEWFPVLTPDGLTLLFASSRPDAAAKGNFDIWTATRPTQTSPFGAPIVMADASSAAQDYPHLVSANGCRLYISSNRSGDFLTYVADRPP